MEGVDGEVKRELGFAARAASTVLGIATMGAPELLDLGRGASVNAWIFGPLIVSVAVIAIADVTRPVRWLNVPIGAWMAVSMPFLVDDLAEGLGMAAIGVMVALLALVGPRIPRERLGGGWVAAIRADGDPGGHA